MGRQRKNTSAESGQRDLREDAAKMDLIYIQPPTSWLSGHRSWSPELETQPKRLEPLHWSQSSGKEQGEGWPLLTVCPNSQTLSQNQTETWRVAAWLHPGLGVVGVSASGEGAWLPTFLFRAETSCHIPAAPLCSCLHSARALQATAGS